MSGRHARKITPGDGVGRGEYAETCDRGFVGRDGAERPEPPPVAVRVGAAASSVAPRGETKGGGLGRRGGRQDCRRRKGRALARERKAGDWAGGEGDRSVAGEKAEPLPEDERRGIGPEGRATGVSPLRKAVAFPGGGWLGRGTPCPTMSDTPNFVHLHFHTCYSLLDGATKVKEAVKQAKEFGMHRAGHHGPRGDVRGRSSSTRRRRTRASSRSWGARPTRPRQHVREAKLDDGSRSQANHLILLSESNEGYQNLDEAGVQAAHIDGYYYKPRIDRALPGGKHAKGLLGHHRLHQGEVTERHREGRPGQGDHATGRGVRRHLRQGQLLHRAAEPRDGGTAAGCNAG
jgi:hypothetical protein